MRNTHVSPACLAPLAIPLATIPGNHDAREPMRRAFPAQPYRARQRPEWTDGAGRRSRSYSSGFIGAGSAAWRARTRHPRLARQRLGASEAPALVFLHIRRSSPASLIWNVQNLRNADALAAILRKHKRARLVAAGPSIARADVVCRRPATKSARPPNHAVDLDLAEMRVP